VSLLCFVNDPTSSKQCEAVWLASSSGIHFGQARTVCFSVDSLSPRPNTHSLFPVTKCVHTTARLRFNFQRKREGDQRQGIGDSDKGAVCAFSPRQEMGKLAFFRWPGVVRQECARRQVSHPTDLRGVRQRRLHHPTKEEAHQPPPHFFLFFYSFFFSSFICFLLCRHQLGRPRRKKERGPGIVLLDQETMLFWQRPMKYACTIPFLCGPGFLGQRTRGDPYVEDTGALVSCSSRLFRWDHQQDDFLAGQAPPPKWRSRFTINWKLNELAALNHTAE